MDEDALIKTLQSYGGHPEFAKFLIELAKRHGTKSGEFDETPLSSLKEVKQWGIRPHEAVAVFMNTQWAAFSNLLASGKKLDLERVKKPLLNLSVYAGLYLILFAEGQQ